MAVDQAVSRSEHVTLTHRVEGATSGLRVAVEKLASLYGPPPPPVSTDPFELVLWEIVAYLADDDRRAEAMESLRRTVGTSPRQIRAASSEDLAEAVGKGILPSRSEGKLRKAADLAIDDFGGDLSGILDLSPQQAKRALQRFPGIGEPGAEKILLQLRRHPSAALESNGLRVLVRLGHCPEGTSYSATYAAARDLAGEVLGDDFDLLMLARHVLRRHGQDTCRRAAPRCAECVLEEVCEYAAERRRT